MMTSCTSACGPSRNAMLARISAVQQRIGASRLTEASPVLRPTLSGPNSRQSAEPFLVDQRLDRAGIDGALALGDGLEMHRGGHERFARAGGRVQDDILVLEQLQDGRFLCGIKLQPLALGVFEKAAQQDIADRVVVSRELVVECQWHGLIRGIFVQAPAECTPFLVAQGVAQGCIKLARSASRPGSQQPPALPDSLVLWALLAFLRAASRDGSRSAWELDAALGVAGASYLVSGPTESPI